MHIDTFVHIEFVQLFVHYRPIFADWFLESNVNKDLRDVLLVSTLQLTSLDLSLHTQKKLLPSIAEFLTLQST